MQGHGGDTAASVDEGGVLGRSMGPNAANNETLSLLHNLESFMTGADPHANHNNPNNNNGKTLPRLDDAWLNRLLAPDDNNNNNKNMIEGDGVSVDEILRLFPAIASLYCSGSQRTLPPPLISPFSHLYTIKKALAVHKCDGKGVDSRGHRLPLSLYKFIDYNCSNNAASVDDGCSYTPHSDSLHAGHPALLWAHRIAMAKLHTPHPTPTAGSADRSAACGGNSPSVFGIGWAEWRQAPLLISSATDDPSSTAPSWVSNAERCDARHLARLVPFLLGMHTCSLHTSHQHDGHAETKTVLLQRTQPSTPMYAGYLLKMALTQLHHHDRCSSGMALSQMDTLALLLSGEECVESVALLAAACLSASSTEHHRGPSGGWIRDLLMVNVDALLQSVCAADGLHDKGDGLNDDDDDLSTAFGIGPTPHKGKASYSAQLQCTPLALGIFAINTQCPLTLNTLHALRKIFEGADAIGAFSVAIACALVAGDSAVHTENSAGICRVGRVCGWLISGRVSDRDARLAAEGEWPFTDHLLVLLIKHAHHPQDGKHEPAPPLSTTNRCTVNAACNAIVEYTAYHAHAALHAALLHNTNKNTNSLFAALKLKYAALLHHALSNTGGGDGAAFTEWECKRVKMVAVECTCILLFAITLLYCHCRCSPTTASNDAEMLADDDYTWITRHITEMLLLPAAQQLRPQTMLARSLSILHSKPPAPSTTRSVWTGKTMWMLVLHGLLVDVDLFEVAIGGGEHNRSIDYRQFLWQAIYAPTPRNGPDPAAAKTNHAGADLTNAFATAVQRLQREYNSSNKNAANTAEYSLDYITRIITVAAPANDDNCRTDSSRALASLISTLANAAM